MTKILILGASGYIGSYLTTQFSTNGYQVTAVGRSGGALLDCHRYISQDLLNVDEYDRIPFAEADVVIDLISYVPPNSAYLSNSEIRESLKSYENLLRLIGDKHYYFFSSGGAVYGDGNKPFTECSDLKPVSPYGVQKCYQEDLVQAHIKNGAILRVTNPFGGNQVVKNGVGFVGHLLDCTANKRILKLTVPSITVRDYIYLFDLSDIVLKLVSTRENGLDVFNVSSGKGVSLETLISTVNQKKNLEVQHELCKFDEQKHIFYNVLDNTKLCKKLSKNYESTVISYVENFVMSLKI